jgi:hypothetical protein
MSSGESSHIDIGLLFESARANAGLDEASQSHAANCELCRSRIHWMRTATELGPHELQYEPPEAALNHVLRFGRSPQYLKKLRNLLVASLTFDSFNDPAPVGVRSSASASHELTFDANEFEVSVSFRPSEDRKFTLMGQVNGKHSDKIEDPDAYVDLVLDGDHIAKSTLSPWGEFIFQDVDAAQYRLQVHIGDLVIWIPQVQIGKK